MDGTGEQLCEKLDELLKQAAEVSVALDRADGTIQGVPQETFDRVQAKLAESRGKTSPRSARQYLLAGLVRCGDCGGSMGGVKPKNPIYRCRLYHQTGRSSCYHNTIQEAPLVRCISRKIQERYTSKPALDRLRRSLEKEQDRTRPRPRDLTRLRKEIEILDRKIDQGAERVLEAPSEIVPTLYRKLEEYKSDRDRIKGNLDALTRHETRPDKRDGSEIDKAINALRSLGDALKRAKPEDSRELLAAIVSKIELHFDHQVSENGRTVNTFTHGIVHVRPDAGEGRGSQPDERSTHLSNKGPIVKRSHRTRPTATLPGSVTQHVAAASMPPASSSGHPTGNSTCRFPSTSSQSTQSLALKREAAIKAMSREQKKSMILSGT